MHSKNWFRFNRHLEFRTHTACCRKAKMSGIWINLRMHDVDRLKFAIRPNGTL